MRWQQLLPAMTLGLLVAAASLGVRWLHETEAQSSHRTNLVAGWNSVCHVGAEEAVADALEEVADDVLAVYRLRADQGYDRWFPDRPDLSTISTLHSYESLFVLMADDAVWEQKAQSSSPASVDLTSGWNSVCYGGQRAPVAEATTGIEGSFSIIYALGTDQRWARFVPGRPDVTDLQELVRTQPVLVPMTGGDELTWVFEQGFVWPRWARTARIAGAFFEPEDGETAIGEQLDQLAEQGVSVVLADCPLGWSYTALHDDSEFAENLDLVQRVVEGAHERGLKVVWYLTGLELISPAERNPADEHPDWLQVSLDGTPIAFDDISSDEEHWLEAGEWDVWVSPCSGYRELFLDRVQEIAGAGVDGLWVDTAYLQDAIGSHEDLLPSTDTCSREAFRAATGLSMPTEEDWESPTFRRWVVWRHEQIKEFLQVVKEEASAENSDIVFFEENWNVDAPFSTRYANDPASYVGLADISTGHEVSTVGDRTDLGEKGMQSATLDQWFSFVTMLKFARGADQGKPSWVLTYGYQPADAERLAGVILAEGANYYETRGPSMADSVGDAYRTRIFSWIAENEDALYESDSLAEVAILYSPRTRDLVDEGGGDSYDPGNAPFFREYRAAAAILLRAHIPFDVIVTDEALTAGLLSTYEVVVLPHIVVMSDEEAAAIRQYTSEGGTVILVGGTGTHDEWFQVRMQNALAGVETDYIGSLTGTAGPQALEVLADRGQIVTDAPAHVHLGLRGDGSSIHVVLVNLGQERVSDSELAVRLPDGSTVEGVLATSPGGEPETLPHVLDNGSVRFTVAELETVTLVSIELGSG